MGTALSRQRAAANLVNEAMEDGGSEDVISKLTEAQLDEFREACASFDKDGGGSIDATELKALMASVGQMPSDEEVIEMIRIADADGSGSVDFCEFVTLMAHKMGDVKSESHLRAAFSLFDHNGDGNLSAEELRRVMINVGEPVTINDVNQLISEVDLNRDGVVNYEGASNSKQQQRSALLRALCSYLCLPIEPAHGGLEFRVCLTEFAHVISSEKRIQYDPNEVQPEFTGVVKAAHEKTHTRQRGHRR
jgi:calmodulin